MWCELVARLRVSFFRLLCEKNHNVDARKQQGRVTVETVEASFELSTYYPIFIYLVFVIGFAVSNLVLTQLIGPWRVTRVKQMPYESGMDPIGSARQRFDIKYYLIALMFLIFDVELLFLYPWAVSVYQEEPWIPVEMQPAVFWAMFAFLILLALAYLYDWKKGVFRWR